MTHWLKTLAVLSLFRFRSILRDRDFFIWGIVFPIAAATILSVAFQREDEGELSVTLLSGAMEEQTAQRISKIPNLVVSRLDERAGRNALAQARTSLLVHPTHPIQLEYDPHSAESRLALLTVREGLQSLAGRHDVLEIRATESTSAAAGYVHFLIPGLLAMLTLQSSVGFSAFVVASERQRQLLKRFATTPMARSHYLLSIVLARCALSLVESALLTGFSALAFDFRIESSLVEFSVAMLLMNVCFCCLGFVCASRARSTEGAAGLANLFVFPMILVGGVFFPTRGFPSWLTPLIDALPLSAAARVLRALAIDGAPLWSVTGEMALLALVTVAALLVALSRFRWQ